MTKEEWQYIDRINEDAFNRGKILQAKDIIDTAEVLVGSCPELTAKGLLLVLQKSLTEKH
jgi:hypothetical protein